MDFSTKEITIGGILQSEKFYSIPKYQRNYVWKESKIRDLWQDIIFNMEEKDSVKYFLGSFIVKNGNKTNEIIDGQQRLTSLLILLGIICREYIKINDKFNIDYTTKYCVLGDPESNTMSSRLTNDDHLILNAIIDFCTQEHEESTLEEYITSTALTLSKNDINFITCYNIYNEYVNNLIIDLKITEKTKKLSDLRNSITNISAILITVDDSKSASLVFETINARGQSLEIQDLIKNYLFMYEKTIGGKSSFEKTWSNIIERIENSKDPSLPRFFACYCTSFFGKKKKDELFDTYKAKIKRTQVADLMRSFDKMSKLYINIVNGTDNIKKHAELNYYLDNFNSIGISILRPLLISLLKAYQDNKIDYVALCSRLKKINAFFSIFVCICSRKTNNIENDIYEYATKLNQSFTINCLDEFINKLCDKIPTYEEFANSFVRIAFSNHKNLYDNVVFNKNKLQYILSCYEIFEQKSEDFVIPKFSLEHIMDDCLGGNACYIGNFVLLPPRKNNKLAGKDMAYKQKIYADSCFSMTRKFSNHPDILIWNDDAISARGHAMAKIFYKNIWKI